MLKPQTYRTLNIVAHKWKYRSAYTSVERMCSLLESRYNVHRSGMVDVPQAIATRLKKLTNSRAYGDMPAPYNSLYLKYECAGILDAMVHPPEMIFFPYADYDYFFASFMRPVIRSYHLLYSYFSVDELKLRYSHLHHYERADCIFVAGRAQAAYLERQLPDVRVEYLPLGVDTEYFTPSEGRKDLVIVQAGVNRRDIPLAFEVLDRLYAYHRDLRAEFVGCASLKESLPARSYLTVHDYLDDAQLRDVYRRASFQILPLLDGGSSNSLNEGYACGLPVIVTQLDNITDYVDPDASLFVQKGDAEGFFSACMRLCEDQHLRQAMGQAARRRAEELSWVKVIDRFDIVVQELLEN